MTGRITVRWTWRVRQVARVRRTVRRIRRAWTERAA